MQQLAPSQQQQQQHIVQMQQLAPGQRMLAQVEQPVHLQQGQVVVAQTVLYQQQQQQENMAQVQAR
jgi:hypothetical protein